MAGLYSSCPSGEGEACADCTSAVEVHFSLEATGHSSNGSFPCSHKPGQTKNLLCLLQIHKGSPELNLGIFFFSRHHSRLRKGKGSFPSSIYWQKARLSCSFDDSKSFCTITANSGKNPGKFYSSEFVWILQLQPGQGNVSLGSCFMENRHT